MTLAELFQLLRKHLRLVIVLPVVLAALVAIVSFFMPDQYTASTTMYVLSRQDESAQSTNMFSDLNASQMLTNDVATILKSDRVSADVAEQLGLEDLDAYDVSVDNTTTTRVITLSVTGTDPVMTAQVANAFVTDVSSVAQEVMNVQSVNVIDSAATPTVPSGPRRALYTAVGFLAGLFIAVAIVVAEDALNTRVRNSEEVEELVGLPVVGHFPVSAN
jgi:capsular polysaccharide biosynthesis protein